MPRRRAVATGHARPRRPACRAGAAAEGGLGRRPGRVLDGRAGQLCAHRQRRLPVRREARRRGLVWGWSGWAGGGLGALGPRRARACARCRAAPGALPSGSGACSRADLARMHAPCPQVPPAPRGGRRRLRVDAPVRRARGARGREGHSTGDAREGRPQHGGHEGGKATAGRFQRQRETGMVGGLCSERCTRPPATPLQARPLCQVRPARRRQRPAAAPHRVGVPALAGPGPGRHYRGWVVVRRLRHHCSRMQPRKPVISVLCGWADATLRKAACMRQHDAMRVAMKRYCTPPGACMRHA